MTDALEKLIEAVMAGEDTPDFACMGIPRHRGLADNAYRGSLDAALALHEALLPRHGWGAGPWGARVWLYSDDPKWDGSERQEVEMVDAPARAWLLAILRAKLAEARDD